MLPVILSVGPITISSFGLFLALSIVTALFTVWRIGRSYDVPEDKITNLTILTFLGGLIGARLMFVILYPVAFDSLTKVLAINQFPGLSFWGGLIGGCLSLYLALRKSRLNYWQMFDYASVGLISGLIMGNIGCFLSGCGYGIISNLPIAMPVVGLVGNRLPVSLVEALILVLVFRILWIKVIRFHYPGQVLASALIYLGLIKFFGEFLRGDQTLGHVFSLVLIFLGMRIFYTRSKRKIKDDLRNIVKLILSSKRQEMTLSQIKKGWYNLKIGWTLKYDKFVRKSKKTPKKVLRRLNVKLTPKDIK